MTAVSHVVVAIPVHNEEALLSACLASVNVALEALARVHPHVQTAVAVALDGCSDRSSAIAGLAGAHCVALDGAGVGVSRDTAVRHGLSVLAGPDESQTWLACTDADTLVPSNWLVRQLIWADSGTDLVLGTVEPFDVADPEVLAAWQSRHRLAEGHSYVHGANLGVRVSRWREVGGFGLKHAHEDVSMTAKVQATSAAWVATDTIRVRTSGRVAGRAPKGFADYLNELGKPQ
ncbi:MAG: glycosyltransferase family 2 protein [Ornithinimicrobium sp.]